MKAKNIVALVVPPVVGLLGGVVIGSLQYRSAMTAGKSANITVTDSGDVMFGYTVLDGFAGLLGGLLIGVFLYGFLRLHKPE